MKRSVIIPIILGSASAFLPVATLAATLTYEVSYPATNTDWETTLTLPKYNPAEHGFQPLKSVFVEAIADSSGIYNLRRTGVSNIRYGTISSAIGAELDVIGPLESIILTPVPIDSVGMGRLTAANPMLSTIIEGSDTKSAMVEPRFLSLYSGRGNVTFNADAASLVNISKMGTPFQEQADIKASLLLRVTYEFDEPAPKEIPEPSVNMGIFAVAFCGLAGLILNRRKDNHP